MTDSIRERQQAERGVSGLSIEGNPKISMVVACYENTKKILVPLGSFQSQTHENWECIIVHDGPGGFLLEHKIRSLQDPRFQFYRLPENSGDWGNSCKEYGSQLATGDYIGHSNDDNFYAPVYFEWMLRAMKEQEAQFVYCNMIHSHRQYQPMSCDTKACHIDGGGWIAEAEIVKTTPWPSPKSDNHADGYYVESLVARCSRTAMIPGYLFVH